MHVSLVHGPLPLLVALLTFGTLTLSVCRRRPGWLATLTKQLVLAAAVMGIVHVAIRWSGVLPYRFPRSFYAWCGLPVFAALVARAGWRDASLGRRVASVSAVVCTAVFASTLVNLHYEFYPTLAGIVGPVSADAQTPAQVAELRTWARASGRLPERGAVMSVDPPATVSGFRHRPGFVYLPPAWFAEPRPPLATVLMVAGNPGLTSDWIRAGLADQTADRFAAAHTGVAPVLVFADQNGSGLADTECVDGPRGRAETYLTVDVRRWAVETLDVPADPAHWAVAGFSEGGTCAITLALRHPDLFQTFADFSGDLAPSIGSPERTIRDLFGGSAAALQDHEPLSLLTRNRYPNMAAWFEVGTNDRGPLAAAHLQASAARAAGIDTHLLTRPGKHNFAFWRPAFEHALPWLATRLGIVQEDKRWLRR